MALVNEVKRTGTVTKLSVYYTNRGEKVWLRHRRGKRGKIERGVNLTKGRAHSELVHSNIVAMKPMT